CLSATRQFCIRQGATEGGPRVVDWGPSHSLSIHTHHFSVNHRHPLIVWRGMPLLLLLLLTLNRLLGRWRGLRLHVHR
ncbi:hypothetical protein PMAYCL1PPCAC_13319, partial [Pristionchus mayeri]